MAVGRVADPLDRSHNLGQKLDICLTSVEKRTRSRRVILSGRGGPNHGRPHLSPRNTSKRSSRKTRQRVKRTRRGQVRPARTPKRVEIGADELRAIVERTRDAPLSEEDHATLSAAVDTLTVLTQELEEADVTIGRLRKLLFGSSSEKTRDVVGDGPPAKTDGEGQDAKNGDEQSGVPADGADAAAPEGSPERPSEEGEDGPEEPEGEPKKKGHGRNGADAYTGAEQVVCPHGVLQHGDRCPECLKGKVYRQKKPAVLVRVRGVAPLEATVYELERLRCNLCGQVFTAEAPPGVGDHKYDETAAAMIAMLKYGCGLPFNRLQVLGDNLGMPLPSGTQWGVVEQGAEACQPAFDELIRQAALGVVVHIDDTNMQVLDLDQQIRDELERGEKGRTGIFTSGVLSTVGEQRIAIFFTGRQHAGENLASVLAHRSDGLDPPILMCDALSRNTSGGFKAIVANCLAHARRKHVDVVDAFPDEVAHVLEELRKVYQYDAEARERGLSAEQRLRYHQEHSQPVMTQLESWLQTQFDERRVEPNSTLGKAIIYMQNHWQKLTLFLRVPGAPLDNNICERALKRAILHRKNSLFFKTTNGAKVGDLYLTLIHTAELCGANPFDYLVALQRHAAQVKATPGEWLPWNFGETLARMAEAPAGG